MVEDEQTVKYVNDQNLKEDLGIESWLELLVENNVDHMSEIFVNKSEYFTNKNTTELKRRIHLSNNKK